MPSYLKRPGEVLSLLQNLATAEQAEIEGMGHATDETITVVVHGRVGLTLLNLLHTTDLDVDVTATATPRRSG